MNINWKEIYDNHIIGEGNTDNPLRNIKLNQLFKNLLIWTFTNIYLLVIFVGFTLLSDFNDSFKLYVVISIMVFFFIKVCNNLIKISNLLVFLSISCILIQGKYPSVILTYLSTGLILIYIIFKGYDIFKTRKDENKRNT